MPFPDEVVERGADREARDAQVAAQLPLGGDRLADPELLDEVEDLRRASRSASSRCACPRRAAVRPVVAGPWLSSRGQVHSPAPAGAATPATGSSRAVVDSACAVFDVEEVEPRRIERELERHRPAARARLRVEARREERGVRRAGASPRRPPPRSRRRGRGASTRKHACVSAPSSSRTSTWTAIRGRCAGREGAVLEGLRPDAEHDAGPARRGRCSGSSGTAMRPEAHDAVLERRLDEVHGRRPDERGDEDVARPRVERAAARSTCTSRPSRITATRWPSVIASVWSWVT